MYWKPDEFWGATPSEFFAAHDLYVKTHVKLTPKKRVETGNQLREIQQWEQEIGRKKRYANRG